MWGHFRALRMSCIVGGILRVEDVLHCGGILRVEDVHHCGGVLHVEDVHHCGGGILHVEDVLHCGGEHPPDGDMVLWAVFGPLFSGSDIFTRHMYCLYVLPPIPPPPHSTTPTPSATSPAVPNPDLTLTRP